MTELRKNEFIEILLEADLEYDDRLKFIHCEIPTLGKITYYPKANKIQISKTNTWEENGLQFVKNILNSTVKSVIQEATLLVKIKEIKSNKELRDNFAIAAMQGHIASEYGAMVHTDDYNTEALAKRFYEIADAMLKQSAK